MSNRTSSRISLALMRRVVSTGDRGSAGFTCQSGA